jgi:hypothetical protein
MDEDAKFINDKGLHYSIETEAELPSAKRFKVGLLQDGDGAN